MEDETEKYCQDDCTLDGTVDRHGRPAIRATTGSWFAVNQGLCTLAFYGVGVNLVLFLTRVIGQNNANAANNVGKWTGTVYLFSLLGAFLSDSYWGRYKTCAIFQAIFVVGLVSLSLSSYLFLVKPKGCGDGKTPCGSHSSIQTSLFYVSIYLVALGNGGYQPNVATFGADQFDEEHPKESYSKVAFFSYFYLALNLGMLFSNTILGYFENEGMWALGFWASAGSAMVALVLFLVGTPRYRHFVPKANPWKRFCQVIVAASRKWKLEVPLGDGDLYEVQGSDHANANGERKILHSHGLKFLDKAAVKTPKDQTTTVAGEKTHNPWRLCSVTQVEEVKTILRLLPIWLCTIVYSLVYTQMTSLFVEQGAAMKNDLAGFKIPPASMSAFEIVSAAAFILIHRRLVDPVVARVRKSGGGLTEIERMGIGLAIAVMSMVAAGVVESFRIRSAVRLSSGLTIFWQLEFFNGQAPDGLRSFGSALSMTSISLGNYASSLILTIVTNISTSDGDPGWIPRNLNKGHLDNFFYLLAVLTAADLVPQYVFIGISEIYMLVGQLEFFNGQAPDGLRSFGSALSMTSISLGNYASSLILTIVTNISTSDGDPGWIPRNLNKGHLDNFFYLLAVLTAADLVLYVVCAKLYKYTKFEERNSIIKSKNEDMYEF
ncbi:protein nrt1/ ptr family 7.3 [Phtheirospermum japonicum]|uniref:Protein nrt1/ ptr family 7.3 n=1 Tax=Phtheirospermum japonicum TaxID=374723 RepID=A0A830CCZ7_9LAMI|nr:protein nrt1/ ptr family 7.3 [Phtheirospermum japonicum]